MVSRIENSSPSTYIADYSNRQMYPVHFKADATKDDTVELSQNEKKDLSTGTKVAIGTGIVIGLAIGADFLFCKGKHVKSILGKGSKNNGSNGGCSTGTSKPNASPTNTTHTTTSATVGRTTTSALFDGKSPVNIGDYTPVQQRAREFAMQESLIFSHGKPDNMFMTNISPETIYRNAVKLKYNNIRSASYKINSRYNQSIDKITGTSTSEIVVNNNNNWNYRIPKAVSLKDSAIDRISLNVYPDEQLITLLDKYFATGKVKGYYKTPDRLADWSLRHDPITIYLQEPVNQSIIDDIIKISKPHIRSTENVLIGKTVSPGIALDKSPSTQDLMNLIQEARQYDETLAHLLETSKAYGFARNPMYGDYTLQSSAGQVAAVRALLDAMAKAV